MSRIRAETLVIDFPIYGTKSRSLKNTVIRAATGGILAKDAADRVVVRALDQVSFEWREGDRIGLTGHNGSGKTTLLRAIAGIYEPVGGSITVEGRVASMLSIMLGMEPEASGYENIFLRGVTMGLTRPQIEEIVGDVCEFSELGDYIDMPMRTYSSGMAMRLAFAISTSVKADILLMDEWLSVGDEAFAEKSKKRLHDLIGQAKILVLASHSPDVLRANCSKLIRLDHGRIVAEE
jgi:lipopolysaccharide transport system ATP-binding protein